MTAADQIAEINAQYAERVKLLQAERDAKVAMVRGRCAHEEGERLESMLDGMISSVRKTGKCKHCGAPML